MLSSRLTRRARRRVTLSIAIAGPAVLLPLVTAGTSSGSSVGGDHLQITALEARISAETARVDAIVEEYNTIAGKLVAIDRRIATGKTQLARDQASTAHAASRLRSVAVNAYVDAQFGNLSAAAFSGGASGTQAVERNAYLATANSALNDAIASFTNDKENTAAAEAALQQEQTATAALLTQVSAAKAAADAAVSHDNAMLSHVNANLLALVAQANARRQAEQARERAAERAIAAASAHAAASAQATAGSTTPTQPIAPLPASGSYANPLRGVAGLRPERIDQGVDYSGYGPVFAIGNGVVLSTVNGGWPGGAFICYRLTSGPAAGRVVYVAEDLEPTVSVGQTVTSSTVIGRLYGGYYGMETGWADPSADGATMAADHSQFWGGNSTAFGVNFSHLLASLGAPGGIIEEGVSGALPAGWPSF
jgi:murein DD-endopeptidase MepM/ murein hydrolase activator NlpD